MKKVCFILIISTTLFLFFPLTAQNIQIGPVVGLALVSLDIDMGHEPQDVNTSTRIGFAFGGSFYVALSSNIGFQFEPAYIQKGSKADVKWVENGSNFNMDQTLKVNYIDIPLLFKASIVKENIEPYILAGANIGLKLGDLKAEVNKITVDGQDITNQIPSDEREVDLKTKSADFGINFGAGILIPIGNNHIFLEGQYNIGLADIYDEEDTDQVDLKNKGILIKAGILFPLGK
jgi:hypothetical protein